MAGLSNPRLERMRPVLSGPIDRREVAGLVALVSRGDEIHLETLGVQDLATGAPMTRETIFRLASISKPITAVAAMTLVEQAVLRLDDSVEPWLPELADRKVLRSLDGPVDDTVPAHRAITLRDLLTFQLGFGAIMAPPGAYPIQALIAEAGIGAGAAGPQIGNDEYMRRLGALPLLHQPGERWMYHSGSDVLGVLIARVTGKSLGEALRERVFDPLRMHDTGFTIAPDKIGRLAGCYERDAAGALQPYADPRPGGPTTPVAFESGGGGLFSTVDDMLAFGRMMLAMGYAPGGRILGRPTVELMTTDQISAAAKAASPFFPGFWEHYGWGFGVSVVTRRGTISETPGRYGWDGGFGTTLRIDPKEDMISLFLMQRMMTAPDDTAINEDFLTLAYQAIED